MLPVPAVGTRTVVAGDEAAVDTIGLLVDACIFVADIARSSHAAAQVAGARSIVLTSGETDSDTCLCIIAEIDAICKVVR